jgi:hypothetical protein
MEIYLGWSFESIFGYWILHIMLGSLNILKQTQRQTTFYLIFVTRNEQAQGIIPHILKGMESLFELQARYMWK